VTYLAEGRGSAPLPARLRIPGSARKGLAVGGFPAPGTAGFYDGGMLSLAPMGDGLLL